MDPVKIGEFIKARRKECNMSQSELANKLNVTSQAVSKWENGRGIPDIELLKKLSEIFNVNVDELLDGEKIKDKNKRFEKYIYFGLLLLIVVGFIFIIIQIDKDEPFKFSSLATDNDAFTIKGVMAYNKNKKSIYISEVHYDKSDEEKYKDIECILYEANDGAEKIISVWENSLNGVDTYFLSELLQGIEFNVDNYECSCEIDFCSNLYLRINVVNDKNKTITYKIPIQVETTCNK